MMKIVTSRIMKPILQKTNPSSFIQTMNSGLLRKMLSGVTLPSMQSITARKENNLSITSVELKILRRENLKLSVTPKQDSEKILYE